MTHTLDPIAAYALWADTYPPQAHNAVMLAEERALLSLLPRDLRGLRVVDVGCGTGRYLRHMLARDAVWPIGIDLSHEMLVRAIQPGTAIVQSTTTHLPLHSASADVIVCALMLGHVESLGMALRELSRVVQPNGLLACSDFHPIGATFGWQRTFKHAGQRFAVRHFTHTVEDWQTACDGSDLTIEARIDALIEPRDVPAGANFDPRALEFPVAHAFALRKRSEAPT